MSDEFTISRPAWQRAALWLCISLGWLLGIAVAMALLGAMVAREGFIMGCW